MSGKHKLGGLFCIESKLGSGGGGVVYKAWHKRLQKHVVLKEQLSGAQGGPVAQRNEAEALKGVKSAYLPQVFDFLIEGDRSYTVLEFIEGESFDKLLRRGETFTRAQAVKWYGQLAAALEAIHGQGICHRDIKPANIMLTPGGDVCLIDFNAALIRGRGVGFVSRSLGYASPEQCEAYERVRKSGGQTGGGRAGGDHVCDAAAGNTAACLGVTEERHSGAAEYPGVIVDCAGAAGESLGESDVQGVECDSITVFTPCDSSFLMQHTQPAEIAAPEYAVPSPAGGVDWKLSDIYSLGATMYHILTGERPPEHPSGAPALSKPKYRRDDLARIVGKSMRPEPSERFSSASGIADALRSIGKRRKVQVTGPKPSERLLDGAAGIINAAAASAVIFAVLSAARNRARRGC